MRKLNLLIVILSFFLVGADAPNLISYPENKIMGFRGLDTYSSAPLIADGRATTARNVTLSAAYDLRKRYGMDTINDASLDDLDLTDPAITGIFDAEFSDGTSHEIVFVGNKIKYDNSGTWTEIGDWWLTPSVTTGKNNQWQCVMANNTAICVNDADVPIEISSTPAKTALDVSSLSDTLTKAKAIAWFRNYLIFGNTVEASTERPTRFRWSNVGTTETYSDDDYTDLSALAGDEIVGFAELYGELYIFLKRSIWRATLVGGDDIFVFKKVVDGIGAIARDSIKVATLSDDRTVIFFLDERNKILMFDVAMVTDAGRSIQPTLDNFNEARLQYAVGTFDGESYYLSVSTGSETINDTVYVYQTEIFEWTTYTQIDANAFAQIKDSSGNIKTYVGNYDSIVY